MSRAAIPIAASVFWRKNHEYRNLDNQSTCRCRPLQSSNQGRHYCSGQIGLDPATGKMVEGVIAQANRAFDNLEAVLTQAGAKMTDVVKFTIFLTDINDFAQVNEVMASHVPTPYPARSCMQVAALPKGALVEVEAIAVI